MKSNLLFATVILFVLSCVSTTQAQNQELKLKSGFYELIPNVEVISYQDLASAKFNNDYYVYVHFTQIPTNENKVALRELGVELLDYVPSNSFLSKINQNVNLANLKTYAIDGVYLVTPILKMSNALATSDYPEHAISGNTIQLIVHHIGHVSEESMHAYYRSLGASIVSHYSFSNLTTISISIDKIDQVAQHPLVKYLEPIDPEANPEDVVGQSNHRSSYISNPVINSVPFNGAGVWLAIGDDGFLGPHIDYAGRMDQTNVSSNNGNHGDHVSGIMMGAGNKDPKAQGMAWGADIMVYQVWNAVYSTPTSYYNPGVVVTSTSYGNGCNAGYTSFARTVDQQVRMMPNLMHVFSCGNSGSSNCGYGAGNGWGNITGGVKVGKNVLAVGNVRYTDGLATSSSRGPAEDGRIKPDICANGTSVYSCFPNNQYVSNTGTSMAAPGVSGTYGQLVQAYRVLNNGVTPTSALVKGTMLNCADDLGNVGPDFKFGWGRLNARRVVEVFKNNTYELDSISQSGSNAHTITIPANVKQVKIMVYWNDYEGSTVSSTALVNNLDMTVTDPSSTTLLPYLLDHSPNPTSLNTPATNGVDNLNNMEQVVIDNPTAGTYTVNVAGTSIPQGPQRYYMIYEFITEEIVVTFPAGGESFTSGTAEVVRWDAVTGTNSFVVEYSIDNGATWNSVAPAPSSFRYVIFNPPNVVTGQGLIRVTRNGVTGQSVYPFNIIGIPSNISFPSSCPNSFEVSWNAVPGATEYEVSVLGAKYMDSVMTVTSTTANLNGFPSSSGHWVSVKAKANGVIGQRAIAVEKSVGEWNCVLSNAEIIADSMPCITAGAVTITNAGAGAGTTFLWDFGVGATPPTANTAGPHTITYATTGIKNVNLIVSNSTNADTADMVIHMVNPPVSSFTSVYNNTTSEMSFTLTSSGYSSVSWDFGDGSPVSSVINPVHTYPSKGNYTVKLTVTNACGEDILQQQVNNYPLGLNDPNFSGSLVRLFPNPSNGNITIQFNGLDQEEGDVTIVDVNGKVVYQQMYQITGVSSSSKINWGEVSQGIYFLNFTSNTHSQNIRIVIQ